MPELEISIDHISGETSMRIKGIKGKKCQPLHEAVNRDMLALGASVTDTGDTPEMNEVETVKQTARIRLHQ